MIKINLCPIDEIETQYWYLPDLVAAAVVALVVFLGVQYYLGTVQDHIDELTGQQQSLVDNTNKLLPDLERFKNLGRDVAELDAKVKALQSITVSKIAKYKPLIVLEHFQNLKPEGVWFNSLRIGGAVGNATKTVGFDLGDSDAVGGRKQAADNETFEIKGQAFDNILTAEFITAVRSTASQELDDADLRTQVFFADLVLEEAEIPRDAPRGFPEMARFPDFALKGSFKEASAAPRVQGGMAPGGAPIGGRGAGGGRGPGGPKGKGPRPAPAGAAPGDDVPTGGAPAGGDESWLWTPQHGGVTRF